MALKISKTKKKYVKCMVSENVNGHMIPNKIEGQKIPQSDWFCYLGPIVYGKIDENIFSITRVYLILLQLVG